MEPAGEITELIIAARAGDRSSEEKLLELVYGELHRLAAGYLRAERKDHTLQASALVNEAYMRLFGKGEVSWENRAHFYTTAARTMRRILIDYSRRRVADKRPNSRPRAELTEGDLFSETQVENMLIIDEALERLRAMDARQAEVMELRFFGGLSVEETAQVLSISEKTVKRDWSVARAWLEAQLSDPS
ncbi:MAG: sigma-70 family RNA polymerase sigma factor [Acidobacteria bacterium]|nr:sigma-70 family RNA polymerase sigma factor [Acidobacteriota bacterium]